VLAKLWLIKCDSENELLVALAKNLKQVACMQIRDQVRRALNRLVTEHI
jgi:hypothetical protein